ncbi:MAG: gamma-glutamylcyclotransferase [Polyangiales bacterium]
MLYFAYGSNLHAKDLARYCTAHGHRPFELPGRAAQLPDYLPAFHYHSTSRQGGALDAAASLGHACAGALFDLSPDQVSVLDEKESAGVNYERRDVIVACEGALLRAFTYCVREERRERFIAPTAEYLQIVSKGYAAFAHDDENLRRAATKRPPRPVNRLFVYGTLMRGESRERFLRAGSVAPAHLGGMCLLDLSEYGDYPGMRQVPTHPEARVLGELVELDAAHMPSVLRELDAVEDFFGYDDLLAAMPRSMYERTLCEVGGELAWTYVLRPGYDGPRIVSGDWRRRGGVGESEL